MHPHRWMELRQQFKNMPNIAEGRKQFNRLRLEVTQRITATWAWLPAAVPERCWVTRKAGSFKHRFPAGFNGASPRIILNPKYAKAMLARLSRWKLKTHAPAPGPGEEGDDDLGANSD